jgi:hypothetical protein
MGHLVRRLVVHMNHTALPGGYSAKPNEPEQRSESAVISLQSGKIFPADQAVTKIGFQSNKSRVPEMGFASFAFLQQVLAYQGLARLGRQRPLKVGLSVHPSTPFELDMDWGCLASTSLSPQRQLDFPIVV